MAAIRYRTPRGERFDGFGMDIESTLVRSIRLRNRRLIQLSGRVRRAAGPQYPLGAIIPAPVQIVWSGRTGFWPYFPYRRVARSYDVFLPMGYYSYWGSGRRSAYRITRRDTRLIRRATGQPSMPVHPIGGLAAGSAGPETAGFAKAARRSGCIGASMYDWESSQHSDWRALDRIWGRPAASGAAGDASASPSPSATPTTGSEEPTTSPTPSPATSASPSPSPSPTVSASETLPSKASPSSPAAASKSSSPSPSASASPSAPPSHSASPSPSASDWPEKASPAQVAAGLKVLRLVLPTVPRVPAPRFDRD